MQVKEQTAVYGLPRNGLGFMEWRRERGISRELFAELTNCSVRKLATYEKVEELPEGVNRAFNEVIHLLIALEDLAGGQNELKGWLLTENAAFGGETPVHVIKSGRADLLWEMVFQLRHGAFV